MLISVIVPVYNVEKYLSECIDSLLSQTYKELEIIMVDDGSKDSSGNICDEYAAKYESCKVVHKKNAGLGMARNTGIEYITGKYVTFVDADDYLDEDIIEKLFNGLVNNGVDMCKCGFRRVDDNGKILKVRSYSNELFEGSKARDVLCPRMIGSVPFQHDSVEMCVCGVLYNADLIKQHKIRFVSERKLISEDLVFNVDYMQCANGACLIEKTGYNYRVNFNSLTTSYRSDRFEASLHFYLEMKKKLEKLKYDIMVITRLQRMFFVMLRMCIAQENGRNLNVSKKVNINNIKKICDDEIVQDTIYVYPKVHLGLKQRFFLRLIELKCVRILFLLSRLRFI